MSVLQSIGGAPQAQPQASAAAGTPGTIQGPMPFGGGGANLGVGGGIGGAYASAYNSALAQNQALYQNILTGYQQTARQQGAGQQGVQGGYDALTQTLPQQLAHGLQGGYNQQQQGAQQILQGYGQLQGDVLGDIRGIGRSQSQAIADAYAQESGSLAQNMVSRGLGNTTVQGSMQRGVDLDKQKADIALSNQMAQLTAGYRSQLGLAGLSYADRGLMAGIGQSNLAWQAPSALAANLGSQALGYQGQAVQNQTGQANQQLGWMNTVQANYPNAQAYMQAAQGQAALQQQQSFMDRYPLRPPQPATGGGGLIGPHVNSGYGGPSQGVSSGGGGASGGMWGGTNGAFIAPQYAGTGGSYFQGGQGGSDYTAAEDTDWWRRGGEGTGYDEEGNVYNPVG